jgi:MFS family permease
MTTVTPSPTEELTYCAVHPDRETSLRCNKCGRYMCADCAVPTPVGYRCKQCVRQHEDRFFTASQYDYIIIAAICAGLSAAGGYIATMIGILLILIIVAIPIGSFIAELALRATQRRRGRYSAQIGAAGAVLGGIAGGLAHTYLTYADAVSRIPGGRVPPLTLDILFRFTFQDISLLVFVGIVAFFVYSRFKMRA